MKPIKDELNGADFALPSKFFKGEIPRNFKRVSRLEEKSIEQKSIAFYKRILESSIKPQTDLFRAAGLKKMKRRSAGFIGAACSGA